MGRMNDIWFLSWLSFAFEELLFWKIFICDENPCRYVIYVLGYFAILAVYTFGLQLSAAAKIRLCCTLCFYYFNTSRSSRKIKKVLRCSKWASISLGMESCASPFHLSLQLSGRWGLAILLVSSFTPISAFRDLQILLLA